MSETMKDCIRECIRNLNVAKEKEKKAPYKPLLLLLAMVNITKNKERLVLFSEIEKPLRNLCQEFGPTRKSYYPELPFWHLQNDGLWEIPEKDVVTISTRPQRKNFIENNVRGGFPKEVYDLLKKDPEFLSEITQFLLDTYFPTSLHEDILSFLDLSLETKGKKRDSSFRTNVIEAYEHRCAVCGFDARMGYLDFALEAAHIKWVAYGGNNDLQNGLALCVLHHKSFDRGVFTLTDNFTILISGKLHGQSWVEEFFLSFKGKMIRPPHSTILLPNTRYLQWHRENIFKQPARD